MFVVVNLEAVQQHNFSRVNVCTLLITEIEHLSEKKIKSKLLFIVGRGIQ
jgi:hypothetical protein